APPARPKPDERPVRPIARRGAVLAALATVLLVAGAAGAAAHPLGNFTVNTYSGLRVGPDRLVVDYVVDMAEIPTFQTRQAIDADHDGQVAAAEAAAWRARECPRLAAGLRATLDGRPAPLAVTGSSLRFPEGVGGLETLRLECALAAPLAAAGSLAYSDTNVEGRVGWREITAVGDRATLEAVNVPPTSSSARLTTYPEDQLSSPLDQRTATLRFSPGGPPAPAAGNTGGNPASGCEAPRRGSVAEAESGCSGLSTPPVARGGVDRATAAFTALVGERSLSPAFAVVALLLAVGLGAAHAVAPGHGKTVMAAYLVGLRGSLRQAATIGATVTVTHTAGVLVLGLVLSTSRAVASERVYPWLGLGSGLLLAAVGLGLLVRARTGHHHAHGHDHPHPHGHHQRDDHDHVAPGRPLGRRGLVALGLAGGLVPSPSAVVVLLGGIALGQAWFGVALVVAYGLGMAATLTGVGLLLAHLRTRMDRRLHLPAGSLLSRLGRLLPAVTASVIVVVGLTLAASGAAQL
ncbi:MAG TPA: sulfite exporter TauE/SafE family protein, partial [Actinomycetota bacterium]|nr:sulfite exporter TauE/SafE family protein [Actinomycetota bacterium]